MLARSSWQLFILLVLVCLFTACTNENLPVTLTAQAVDLTAQATLLSARSNDLATAVDWASTARVTLTAWPQNAIVTQNALLNNDATTQALVVYQVGTEAVGTSQAVEATIRADEVSVAEAIAATDLAIQVATIEAGRYELATAMAEHDILVATATQSAGDFATGVAQWQTAGTAIAREYANRIGIFAQTSTALAVDRAAQQTAYQSMLATATAAARQWDATAGDLQMTVTAQAEGVQVALATNHALGTQNAVMAQGAATEIAHMEVQLAMATDQVADAVRQYADIETRLAVESAILATTAYEYEDLLAASTRQAAFAQERQEDWQELVTLQADIHASRLAELTDLLGTQDALLTAAVIEPTATRTPTATVTASASPTPTATVTPSATMTASALPTMTPTSTPSLTPTPTITPTAFLCWVLAVNQEGVNIREEPAISPGNVILSVPVHTVMSVVGRTLDDDGRIWYAVRLEQGPDSELEGWVAEGGVNELTDCLSS